METTLKIDGMSCGHCVVAVREALQSVPGVTVKEVAVGSATVTTDGSPQHLDALKLAVEDAGYFAELAAG